MNEFDYHRHFVKQSMQLCHELTIAELKEAAKCTVWPEQESIKVLIKDLQRQHDENIKSLLDQ